MELTEAQYDRIESALPVLRGNVSQSNLHVLNAVLYVRALAAAQASHPDQALTAEKVGLQPYQATEVYERLTIAMRDYR